MDDVLVALDVVEDVFSSDPETLSWAFSVLDLAGVLERAPVSPYSMIPWSKQSSMRHCLTTSGSSSVYPRKSSRLGASRFSLVASTSGSREVLWR